MYGGVLVGVGNSSHVAAVVFLAEGHVYHGTIREDATDKQEVDLDFPLFVRDRKGLTGGEYFTDFIFLSICMYIQLLS